ncbi:general transcription factor IIE subunit 1 [Hydra vulgaris]|uniref:General transcription factor IIE subunit 1 n=1 Tax=Hydra vulgaris TaxID=6087 RepID=A0ABM4BJM5_HYDVU
MNNEQMKIEEPDLLTEVPPILKRLAKTVAYALYEPEQIVTINILTKYPCIDEDTLMEKLQFDKRQLRQVLGRLKNDKLVKQRVVKEKQQDTGVLNVYNFYFINYNLFVNVVKYRLDHMRKKLENEEQQAKNRPSFQCEQCSKTFSDLEVDRLLDFSTGLFKCTFCNGLVEEDVSYIKNYSSSSSLAKFNEQLETIFKLLRQCENINLAPEVLEPTPSTAALKMSSSAKSHSHSKSGWSNDRKSIDIYNQKIQINVGAEVEQAEAKVIKELPVWLSQSTVFEEKSNENFFTNTSDIKANIDKSNGVTEDHEIMSDLLVYESSSKKPRLESPAEVAAHESSDSEPDSDIFSDVLTKDVKKSEEEDGEVTVRVGELKIPLSEVNDDIISKMSDGERDIYYKLYNEAYEQFY